MCSFGLETTWDKPWDKLRQTPWDKLRQLETTKTVFSRKSSECFCKSYFSHTKKKVHDNSEGKYRFLDEIFSTFSGKFPLLVSPQYRFGIFAFFVIIRVIIRNAKFWTQKYRISKINRAQYRIAICMCVYLQIHTWCCCISNPWIRHFQNAVFNGAAVRTNGGQITSLLLSEAVKSFVLVVIWWIWLLLHV